MVGVAWMRDAGRRDAQGLHVQEGFARPMGFDMPTITFGSDGGSNGDNVSRGSVQAYRERFEALAYRYDTLAQGPHTKPRHLACDLDQNTIAAARLLERACDAGLLSGWPAGYLMTDRMHRIYGSVYRASAFRNSDEERLLLFWSMAVGSWLTRDYPEHIRWRPGLVALSPDYGPGSAR